MTKCIYYVNESALDITKYTLKNFCDAFNDEEYAEISDSNYIYLTEKGEKIFNEIFSNQKKRIYKALLNSTAEEVLYFDNVLKKIIHE